MLPASDALQMKHLADRINQGGWRADHMGDNEISSALAHLRLVLRIYECGLVPITKAQILTTLADFADMLQVKAPGDAGIELYLEALSDMPAVLLPYAVRHVAKHHRFARLPLPSDFLAGVAGELAYCNAKLAWPRSLIAKLEKARPSLTHERKFL